MLYATMRIGNNCEYFLFQSSIPKSFKVPLYLRTANSYDGKGSHRIFIPYFQLLIQIIDNVINRWYELYVLFYKETWFFPS